MTKESIVTGYDKMKIDISNAKDSYLEEIFWLFISKGIPALKFH